VLGETIRTNPTPIARHCLKELAPVSEDLATLVEAVALADRMQTRLLTEGWARRLALSIPVFEKDLFAKPGTIAALKDVLGFLTGDAWDIEFTKRTDAPIAERYLALSEEPPKFVVPFSDGLDSFAQVAFLEKEFGPKAVLPLRAGKLQSGRAGRVLLEVPRRFYAGHPREKTYRTRPFVYFTLSAIAAATSGADAVVIGENGQGALGPSFARFYNEWPFRSTHPGFVSRLGSFLSLVLDRQVEFRQPQLWKTKGEVVSQLRDDDLLAGFADTRSCSLRPYQRRERGACGYCGGCILRQNALAAAGLALQADVAFDPGSAELRLKSRSGLWVEFTPNEKEILARAASSMAIFAEMAITNDTSSRVILEAGDIPNMSLDQADLALRSLFRRHRLEWGAFLDALPSSAWLRREFEYQ
jgi:7-cyano-7-deazaguanine synthase in queuosine biosynthesis